MKLYLVTNEGELLETSGNRIKIGLQKSFGMYPDFGCIW